MKSTEEQLKIIMKGVDEVVGKDELKEKLETGKVLTVKLGLDPSAPDIHLGHTVVLRKIKQLQDLGHKAVIIIGDFTGMIGDPTGKSKTRKQLTKEQVIENAKTYEKQIFKVLDKSKTELRFNSEWLSKLNFEDVIKLAATTTVARMLEREDFKKRYTQYEPIGIHEFFYPLMQAYDSVEIKADIELGGTDQRFNLLMGRTLQKEYKQDSQTTIFMPLLEGLDGIEKMSKSLSNYIGIDEPSKVMYEKAMSIPDELIIKYYELVTDVHPDDIQLIKKSLDDGENPRNIKMKLSKEIVKLYHGEEEAKEAEERFIEIFQKGNIPNDILTVKAASSGFDLMKILTEHSLVQSKKEVRRLIEQGGIKINDTRILELENIKLVEEMIIQIGKKKFIKIIIED